MGIFKKFDFRMDLSSWAMIVFMVATIMFFFFKGSEGLDMMTYIEGFGFSALIVAVLMALMSIPVIIYCYFVKMIPDIDYSVRAAFVFTIIGIISEFV